MRAIPLTILFASGCAPYGSHYCDIASTPPGAAFQLGEHAGTTPARVVLERSRHSIDFRCGMAGHETISMAVKPQSGDYPAAIKVNLVPVGQGISTVEFVRGEVQEPPGSDTYGGDSDEGRGMDRFIWRR